MGLYISAFSEAVRPSAFLCCVGNAFDGTCPPSAILLPLVDGNTPSERTMGNEQARSARGEADLHGISAMDQKMQEKFAKGIQFNSEQIKGLSRADAPSIVVY